MNIGPFFWDALERLCKAFVAAFLAQVTGAGIGIEQLADTSLLQRATVAGLAAALSLLFSWLSRWATDDTSSASALPGKVSAARAN